MRGIGYDLWVDFKYRMEKQNRNHKGRHHCSTPLPIREKQVKATASSSVTGRLEAKSGEDALLWQNDAFLGHGGEHVCTQL